MDLTLGQLSQTRTFPAYCILQEVLVSRDCHSAPLISVVLQLVVYMLPEIVPACSPRCHDPVNYPRDKSDMCHRVLMYLHAVQMFPELFAIQQPHNFPSPSQKALKRNTHVATERSPPTSITAMMVAKQQHIHGTIGQWQGSSAILSTKMGFTAYADWLEKS